MFNLFLFCSGNEVDLENHIPLRFHGKFLNNNGFKNLINIFFMSGFNNLSGEYKRELNELGYSLINKETEMESIKKLFPEIAQLKPFLCYTYLRCILFKRLVDTGELTLPTIMIDADIIFTSDPKDIADDVSGKTFILYGSPCFLPISDYKWFEVYEEQLKRFSKNPKEYCNDALLIKQNPVRPDREYCNISQFDVPFRHEQDLQEYLIACGKLPQDRTDVVYDSSFFWIENPLFPGAWFTEQKSGQIKKIVEKNGVPFVGEKRLVFYHFQNDFSWYCYQWMILNKIGLGQAGKFLGFDEKTGDVLLLNRLFGGILRRMPGVKEGYNRQNVCKMVFQENPKTGNLFITDIVNSRW